MIITVVCIVVVSRIWGEDHRRPSSNFTGSVDREYLKALVAKVAVENKSSPRGSKPPFLLVLRFAIEVPPCLRLAVRKRGGGANVSSRRRVVTDLRPRRRRCRGRHQFRSFYRLSLRLEGTKLTICSQLGTSCECGLREGGVLKSFR